MKKIKKTILLIPFILFSCASPYLKNYEPIKIFLDTEKIDRNKIHILQEEKISNIQTLRIFNDGAGSDYAGPIDGTDDLFSAKHWRKLYAKYANDTIKKYWRKKDFIEYNFTLENRKLLFSEAYYKKYPDEFLHNEIIWLSEPLYYWNNNYVLFSYQKDYIYGSSYSRVVIMKKQKKRWIVVSTRVEYILH